MGTSGTLSGHAVAVFLPPAARRSTARRSGTTLFMVLSS